MINVLALQQKLAALRIPARIIDIKNNAFYDDIYLEFDADITYSKIQARKKDIDIFFDSQVEISSDSGLIIFRIPKKKNPQQNLYDYLIPEKLHTNEYILPLIMGLSEHGEKIYYEQSNPYELGGHSPYIVFYTINQHWDTNIVDIGKNGELIKAINKQIEELGWNK